MREKSYVLELFTQFSISYNITSIDMIKYFIRTPELSENRPSTLYAPKNVRGTQHMVINISFNLRQYFFFILLTYCLPGAPPRTPLGRLHRPSDPPAGLPPPSVASTFPHSKSHSHFRSQLVSSALLHCRQNVVLLALRTT